MIEGRRRSISRCSSLRSIFCSWCGLVYLREWLDLEIVADI